MGSVKDLIIFKEPKEKIGKGVFVFSDRFSVFDYGIMPDIIPDKGKSLCISTAYFFEKLESVGIKNHYEGLIENGKLKRLNELENAVEKMQIKLVRVIKPKKKVVSSYDYSIFKTLRSNYLLPLEVIYRNFVSENSSLVRRLKEGKVRPQDYGLSEIKPNQRLEKPIVEFSTKLEDVDRYISGEEAKEISGISDFELEELKSITLKVNRVITREVERLKLENEDGKIEFAFDDNRELMVVDSVGTLDECRFSFGGIEVSKEILRKYYRRTNWYRKLVRFKGQENWRDLVGSPPRLFSEFKNAIADLYRAFSNELVGIKFFDTPPLKDAIRKICEVLE
ncbi:MAG TPA: phosphoribosylaminoimidazolesuccinocarboxamide synthase [Archaeoglobus sp.]|nr:phosphoribosylaminoimidazolesuccinocarboxamide synthase [Archaeoglobus sp.]